MTNTQKNNIKDTVKILMQLDKKSLLLIDSGARILLARQDMDSNFQGDTQMQKVSKKLIDGAKRL